MGDIKAIPVDNEETEAMVGYGSDGHDGPGWYYWDAEYPEEGSIGAFATREEAETRARSEDGGGYTSVRLSTKHHQEVSRG